MMKLVTALGAMGLLLAGCTGTPVESGKDRKVAVQEEVTTSVSPAACKRVCETRCHRDRFGHRVCKQVCSTRCF